MHRVKAEVIHRNVLYKNCRNKKIPKSFSRKLFGIHRSDWVRTSGLHVPNVALYHLSHTPNYIAFSQRTFYFMIWSG